MDKSSDFEIMIRILTRMFIIINAVNYGWTVETIEDDKIVLSKKISMLTSLDHNTPELLRHMLRNY